MRIKIKRWVCAFLLGVLTTILIRGINNLLQPEPTYTGAYTTYTVIPGDTLWSIASDIESDKDIREIIHTIKEDNNMDDCDINVGQQLKLRDEY